MTADNQKNKLKMIYIGPAGSGLGFSLSGMTVIACDSAANLLKELRGIKKNDANSIVFVDEHLAAEVLPEVESLNENALPAIVLLTNATDPKHLAAKKMNRLMIKAVGSDIF